MVLAFREVLRVISVLHFDQRRVHSCAKLFETSDDFFMTSG